MDVRPVELPFAGGAMRWDLPASWSVTTVRPPDPPRPELLASVRKALVHPLGGAPLHERVRPGMRVTIAVPDVTRPCPDHVLVPELLAELARAGVDPGHVTVLFALGMHRRMHDAETARALGDPAPGVGVQQSRGDEAAAFLELEPLSAEETGTALPTPVPVHLHRAAVECDLLLATGVVEPHQYAGYSGAGKTVAVGCAGAPTIEALHGVPFLETSVPGVLENNPFGACVAAIARRARLQFVLNVARTPDGAFLAAGAGDPPAVLRHLVNALSPHVAVPVAGAPFDCVLAGVGEGKDRNLYQASRALTYLASSPRPVVRDGGWIVVAAACPEGAGEGPGEREFLERLRSAPDAPSVLASLKQSGFGAGGQRAYMVARALCRYRGLVVGSGDLSAGILPTVDTPETALERMSGLRKTGAAVLVVPNALAVLPRPAASPAP